MRLEDVEKKLRSLRFKRKEFLQDGIFQILVEAITEFTLIEPPRFWYLLEIPEPSARSSGGWRKIVEIMKRRGYQPETIADEEMLVNSLAEAYTFNAYSKFRKIITALMIKVSREAGLLHYWHRILYVTAKQILDKDLCEDFDPLWNEKLELDESFLEMTVAIPIPNIEIMDGMETLLGNMVVDQQQQHQFTTKGVKRRRKTMKTKHRDRPRKLIPESTMTIEEPQGLDLSWQVQTKIEPKPIPMPPMTMTMQPNLMQTTPICKYEHESIGTSSPMDMMDNNLAQYGVIFV
ncbi:unnamed protein product [Allacma fusca]|uniref:Uncharacterized protein n=1 Tax=Allacma fusca TaxID=39272 RepID=A0A8J2NUM9_9HEXA|nr:unnamed protein product [Allacma fusca]